MCSKPAQVVVDISTSTAASAPACKVYARHFIGLKLDCEIFEALLKPLCTTSNAVGNSDYDDDNDLRSSKIW